MARAPAILQSVFPYNVSARCINKEWFNIPMDRVWEIFCEELSETRKHHKLVIHSFVLMDNHFHLIASTPESNISQCMHRFMGRSSRRLTREGNRINETFAGRHFKCILQHPNYFLNAYKYNYRNPVAAGICNAVELYPFSTLQDVMKLRKSNVLVEEDMTYTSDPIGTLKWLNTPPNAEKLESFRFGLKHQTVRPKRDKQNRVILSENDLL
jgi:putative transposase